MEGAFSVRDGVERRAEYSYDAFGNRRGQTVYSRTTGSGILDTGRETPQDPEQRIRYTIDLTRQYHNLLVLEDHARQKEQTFYWDGNAASMEEDGRYGSYLQDDLGSPMHLLDENGEIRESYGFDEFGMPLDGSPAQPLQPFGFTGYQAEEAGGLYFAQARRYDADAGRFVSEDRLPGRITMSFTLNRYSYCWSNPLVLVDLNGMYAASAAEGEEAHKLLQAFLEPMGVKNEVPNPNSSKRGNKGYADLVYEHDGIAEIYEIKPGSYAPGAVNNEAGKAQLQRYIDHYNDEKEDKESITPVPGTSLNPVIKVTMLPSEINPDKMIKYYVYPSDPGMIYWGYVNKPEDNDEKMAVAKKKKKENSGSDSVIETAEDIGMAAMVAFGLYEIIKWGIAVLLAPETGGASLGGAACMP